MSNPGASPPSTSKMFFLVAVALGILATVLAFVFIQSGASASSGPTVSVVVAKHDLSPATPIDPDRDLVVKQLPMDFQKDARGTLDWASRANYKGKRVNRDIFAGQSVLLSDFKDVGDLVIDEPYRALTISAETAMTIPGDRVKIILGKVATASPSGAAVYDSTIIAPKDSKESGFKVLAVGGYLYKTRSQVTSDQMSAGTNQKTVTLQVTEAEAKELVGALNAMGSNQRATLLICPSDNTRTPASSAPPAEAKP